MDKELEYEKYGGWGNWAENLKEQEMPYVMSDRKESLPPRKKKTPEERLREIRKITNETDNAIENMRTESDEDQLAILRDAMVRITMALGPAVDPNKNKR